MKIKTAAKTVMIILFCICLTSCDSFNFFSVDSLIRAPKITGQYSTLQKAFEESMGTDARTVSPVSGEYRSAYSLTDLDGDREEEAIVFYKRENEDSVRLALFTHLSGEWIAKGDIAGNAVGVHEVFFCDFDSDGCEEIAVVWCSNESDNTDNAMTVYTVSSGSGRISGFQSLATIKADSYLVHTFCMGGENDIFYLSHDTGTDGTGLYAQILSFKANGKVPSPVSRIGLGSAISSVVKIHCEDNARGTRVFLDCKDIDGAYFTEIIDYNKSDKAFAIPEGAEDICLSGKTSRKNEILCTDIDGDGKTEIPADITFGNGKAIEGKKTDGTALIEWREFTGGEFVGKEISFINQTDGYSFCMDSYYESTYITYDGSSHTARWYRSEGRLPPQKETDGILFSVIFTGLSPEKTEKDDFIVVVTEAGSRMNIKKTHISSLIEPLN